MAIPQAKKPRNWTVDYVLKSGDLTVRKYARVRAVDVFDALNMATHKIKFDMIMADRISPDTTVYDDYEIMCIGTA